MRDAEVESRPAARRGSSRRVLLGLAALAAAALAALWLWPGQPIVLRVLGSLAVAGLLLICGLVWVLVRARLRGRLAVLAVLAALGLGVALGRPYWQAPPPPDEEPIPAIDLATWNCSLKSYPVPTITPGTLVGTDAPPGWSQLIFKVKPRYRPESGDVLPAALVAVTNRFSLAMAARVERQPQDSGGRFALQSVGVGVVAECKASDRVTSSRERPLPEELSGFLASSALAALEKDIGSSSVIARTPNLWVVDTPVRASVEGDGQPITRRYALWADPATGRVTTLFWDAPVGPPPAYQPDAEKVYRLPENLVEELPLVLNKGRSGFKALFALGRRPSGSELALAVPLRAELNRPALQESTVRELEMEMARRFAAAGARERRP
jgi:hypothetical protein